MQTAFFKIAMEKVIDPTSAIEHIKEMTKKTFKRKGEEVVKKNIDAIEHAVAGIQEVSYPNQVTNPVEERTGVYGDIAKATRSADLHLPFPKFMTEVTAKIIKQEGETIPVSAMPPDGVWPSGTTQYEKRNIAVNIPVWDPGKCIQCNTCSIVCPHGCIRPKAYDGSLLSGAPSTFKSADVKGSKELAGLKYTLQVAPEDCTGCALCAKSCPDKVQALKMEHQIPLRAPEAANWDFFLSLPDTDPSKIKTDTVKGSQFVPPLFEFSGACLGCGETPYIKLLTQLVGDRLYVANATGCSSIYGGNLPTTPYTVRKDGRGPTWNNSLFEDNAELAYGMRLSVDKFTQYARELAERVMALDCCDASLKSILTDALKADQSTTELVEAQRARIAKAKEVLATCKSTNELCKEFDSVIDYLVK
jgi:pyruvate-ferredoxin/flavodoxin oxidoreductase